MGTNRIKKNIFSVIETIYLYGVLVIVWVKTK